MADDLVSYEDFPLMGLHSSPHYLRLRMRYGRFPKARKGGCIDGHRSRYFWSRSDIEFWLNSQKAKKKKP